MGEICPAIELLHRRSNESVDELQSEALVRRIE